MFDISVVKWEEELETGHEIFPQSLQPSPTKEAQCFTSTEGGRQTIARIHFAARSSIPAEAVCSPSAHHDLSLTPHTN